MSKASSRLMLCLALFVLLATVLSVGGFAQTPTPLSHRAAFKSAVCNMTATVRQPRRIPNDLQRSDGYRHPRQHLHRSIHQLPANSGGELLAAASKRIKLHHDKFQFQVGRFVAVVSGRNWLTYMGYNGADQIEGVQTRTTQTPRFNSRRTLRRTMTAKSL